MGGPGPPHPNPHPWLRDSCSPGSDILTAWLKPPGRCPGAGLGMAVPSAWHVQSPNVLCRALTSHGTSLFSHLHVTAPCPALFLPSTHELLKFYYIYVCVCTCVCYMYYKYNIPFLSPSLHTHTHTTLIHTHTH